MIVNLRRTPARPLYLLCITRPLLFQRHVCAVVSIDSTAIPAPMVHINERLREAGRGDWRDCENGATRRIKTCGRVFLCDRNEYNVAIMERKYFREQRKGSLREESRRFDRTIMKNRTSDSFAKSLPKVTSFNSRKGGERGRERQKKRERARKRLFYSLTRT